VPGDFSLLDDAAAIEKRFGVVVTTRTWNTVTKRVGVHCRGRRPPRLLQIRSPRVRSVDQNIYALAY